MAERRLVTSSAVVLALLLAGLFVGCSAPAAQAPAAPGQEGKPKYGGTFVFSGIASARGPDYHRATSIGEIENFVNVHGTILELSAEDRQTIRGDVVIAWEVSKDSKTYTFKMREGLKTHKGKPFTAEDVAYSVNRIVTRPNGMPIPRGGCIRADVKRVTAPDPQTVVIELKDASASFVACLTNPYIAIQPKYVLEAVDKENRPMRPQEIDGVGPFMLKEWVDGSVTSWKRFDGFYKEGRPYLDEIQGISLPDASAQIAAFRTQRMHQFGAFATTPSVSEAKALKTEFGDKITVVQVEAPGFRGFQINAKKPPLDDVRVREAIDLASNRQDDLEIIYQGAGSFSGPYFGGWDWIYSFEEMSKWSGYRADKTQDLARAKQLLKEAGYSDGLTIENITCGTGDIGVCDILLNDLKKIGITGKLWRGEDASRQDLARKGAFSMYNDSKGAEYDDPDVFNSLYYLPEAGLNWFGWEDKEFIRLYEQQRVERDQKKRGQTLRRMADIIRDSHAYIFQIRPLLHQTWWSYVKGYVPPKSFYQTSYRFDGLWLEK